ncbi:MAG: hypothetical protein AB7V55_00550 [Oscillospiraceae bacterium]
MKNSKKWFWGIFLLAAAVLVVGSQFTSFARIGFWTIAGTVVLVALLVQCLASRNFTVALLSVAVLYILYQKPLHLPIVNSWVLLLAALLAGIGLSMLFRPRRPKNTYVPPPAHPQNDGVRPPPQLDVNDDDNHPYSKVSFGASNRYLHSTALESGQFYVSFGAQEIFFGDAHLAPGGAQLYLDCSFGSIKLYVPRTWRVEDDISAVLGGVEHDTRFAVNTPDSPVLRLSGNVSFGEISVQYV